MSKTMKVKSQKSKKKKVKKYQRSNLRLGELQCSTNLS